MSLNESKPTFALNGKNIYKKPFLRKREVGLTCSYKENPSAEYDVPFALVEAARSDAHPTQQEEYGTEDGEDAGGSHHPCRWQRTVQIRISFGCNFSVSLLIGD